MTRKPPRQGVPNLALVPKTERTASASAIGTMGVELVLRFVVDGAGLARATFSFEVPRPAPGQAAQLEVALDGRAVATMLEPLVGPARGGVVMPQRAGLWVPGKD